MVNLYTLPTYVVVLFIGVILCLFLANSVLYYYLMPQAQFRQLGRKCLEGSSLLLLMAVAAILYEVYTDSLSGIVYDEATDFWRYSTALAGTVLCTGSMTARQGASWFWQRLFCCCPSSMTGCQVLWFWPWFVWPGA